MLSDSEYNHSARNTTTPTVTTTINSGADRSCNNHHNQYTMHKYLLYFLDPEVEQRYYNFQYVDNAFIPGKLFGAMWTSFIVTTFVTLTQPFSDNAAYTIESFTSIWWIGSYISTGVCGLLFLLLFIDRLRPFRELFHLIQIGIGWPTVGFSVVILKRPSLYRYGGIMGAFLFPMLIAQARICRSLPLVTLWPVVCLLVATFGVPGYWDSHTKVEMMYWATSTIPVVVLFFLEKMGRRSFVEREMTTRIINEIEHKTLVTQMMIAKFFPATPTRDLLLTTTAPSFNKSSIQNVREKAYTNVVLIVTDIEMFTAYTSTSTPKEVLRMLIRMYRDIDDAADQYGVEKIATVGDSYCGAIFGPSSSSSSFPSSSSSSEIDSSITGKCRQGMMFSLATLPTTGRSLQLRVGIHIGDVVGMFIGCAPPKFDLFGPGIDHARVMEEEGGARAVHMSHRFIESARILSVATDALPQTSLGVICRSLTELGWCDETKHKTDINEEGDDDSINDCIGGHDDVAVVDIKDTTLIVEALSTLARIEHPTLTQHEADATDDDEGRSHNADDEDDEDLFEFSKVFLLFKRPFIEERFQIEVRKSGIINLCARVFFTQLSILFIIQQNLMCGTNQDQAVSSVQFAILVGMAVYIHRTGTNSPYHFAITPISFTTRCRCLPSLG